MTSSVARARLAHGWTQQRLADVVRVSRQTIIAIEKGNYEPSTSLSLKLALALGAPVEELFTLTAEAAEMVQVAAHEDHAQGTRRTAEKEQAR